MGFPGSSAGKESTYQETSAWFLGREDPPGEGIGTHSGILGFPGGSDSKESVCNVGDLGLILGLGRSPGGGQATHSSILDWRIPTDRVGVPSKEVDMTQQLQHSTYIYKTESLCCAPGTNTVL